MQFSRLSLFAQRIHAGQALPFNVYNTDRTLLLAKGQVLHTAAQVEALLNRGTLVDIGEVLSPAQRMQVAPREALPGLWQECKAQVQQTLLQAGDAGFKDALEASTPAVMALVARDKDLAIFQVLQQEGNAHVQYGLNHAMHTAVTTQLVASRLGWSDEECHRAFQVALTMNVSMFELQGVLAEQATPLTADQRAAILAHPELSRMLLEESGVQDEAWLQAVVQHHEAADGSGYPYGLRGTNDLAALVRRADIYTAKLSPRKGRSAMAADQAGRQMFMQDPGHPMTAALVKEFGVYPPGSWVRLASGECGLVVRRGPTVVSPVVSVMTSPDGRFLPLPVQRDTADKPYAVLGLMAATEARPRVAPEMLAKLAVQAG